MTQRFDVTFYEREDGVKVWSASCLTCGASLHGERSTQVVFIIAPNMDAEHFRMLKERINEAWDVAKRDRTPIVAMEGLKVKSVADRVSVQRALEAHVCEMLK